MSIIKSIEEKDQKKPKITITCKACNINFQGHSYRKYCSPECRSQNKPKQNSCIKCGIPVKPRIKFCKSCKPQKKSTKVYETRKCKTCNTEFETWVKNKTYCKKTCHPSHKQAKRLRKRTKRKAKPDWCSWKDIEKYKESRPSENHHLDHIIPLNHPDVCGLHCPENFQWLTYEDNLLKSNEFDGTMQNESWKKNLD